MIYIVVSKGGGNHERVEAAFMSREVMDGTPEMNRIVLENRK